MNNNNNNFMVCVNDDNPPSYTKVPLDKLPCCTIYQPRTRWQNSILPIKHDDPQKVANQFPFWGLWRTPNSPPLPQVFYPLDIQPLGLCNRGFYGGNDKGPEDNQINVLLSPNWALSK